MTGTTATWDTTKIARANLPSDPRKYSKYTVPVYMEAPEVTIKYDHQIRIWRTKLIQLYKTDVRRICGLIEWTDLETGLTLWLRWAYSVHQKEAWKPIEYILYGHYAGEQPCQDLNDVYRSTTAEINWTIKCLEKEYNKKHRPRIMKSGIVEEDFPR